MEFNIWIAVYAYYESCLFFIKVNYWNVSNITYISKSSKNKF